MAGEGGHLSSSHKMVDRTSWGFAYDMKEEGSVELSGWNESLSNTGRARQKQPPCGEILFERFISQPATNDTLASLIHCI
jgi:hypothetical protein